MFGLAIPQSIPGVDSAVLDPRNGWSSADKWQEKAESLAQPFMDNFKQYSDTEAGARLALAGPQLQKSAVDAWRRPAGEPLYSAKARSASPVRR